MLVMATIQSAPVWLIRLKVLPVYTQHLPEENMSQLNDLGQNVAHNPGYRLWITYTIIHSMPKVTSFRGSNNSTTVLDNVRAV